ncbi:MAG: trypsin-like peptidase domain-containing protein [Pirellulaceae bacterium]
MDDFASAAEGTWKEPLSSLEGRAPIDRTDEEVHPPLHIPAAADPPPSDEPARPLTIHPLDRREIDQQIALVETHRLRLAWAKLLWLLAFLAVLLAISYLVPMIAENTQYAMTRGRQRAERDFALQHLEGSPLSQLSQASQMVSQAVAPSVVHINTQGGDNDIFATPMQRMRGPIPTEGQGSGFIADAGGYIVTNLHVIRDAREIMVTLADGRKVEGRVVGLDKETDLAVLKIEADKLTAVRWGDSDDIQAGAMVWAVGSPFGLERSITSGILSAKDRAGLAGNALQNFLQTDTAVNPGNSGGPLVSTEGRVIGVNTAIVGDAYQGISFAIPSNVAREVYERIRSDGAVRRGWLGVQLEEMTDQHALDLGLESKTGAYIADLVQQTGSGSPAAQAGIQRGDVVVRWNDQPVTGPAELSNLVAKTEIGSTARVVVMRDRQETTLEVAVGLRPDFP